jgi:hypothetical protein
MKKTAEQKYVECQEILYSINDIIGLVIEDIELADLTPMEIIQQSLVAYNIFSNMSPEERLQYEIQTDIQLGQLEEELGIPVEVRDNRKDTTAKKRSKKTLLN